MWFFRKVFCEVCGVKKSLYGDWYQIYGGEKTIWLCTTCLTEWKFNGYPKRPGSLTEWIMKQKRVGQN